MPLDVADDDDNHNNDDILQHIIREIVPTGQLADTIQVQLTNIRRGQRQFRNAVFDFMDCCPVTGVNGRNHLIASHIKPWCDCETASERLDGYNGLPLSPHIDHLFDKGYITFSDDGQLLISPDVDRSVVLAWNLGDIEGRQLFQVSPKRRSYLEYHRTYVFEKKYKNL